MARFSDGFLAFLLRQVTHNIPANPAGINLTKSRFLITGANGGLGFECAKQLLDMHADVILAVRSSETGQETRQKLLEACPKGAKGGCIEIMLYEATSFSSIVGLAQRLASQGRRLDGLILNAACYRGRTWVVTEDGYEECFQVNCLSPILLSFLLSPVLRESASKNPHVKNRPRIVFVGSEAHAWSTSTFSRSSSWSPGDSIAGVIDNEASFKPSNRFIAYNDCKLVDLAWAMQLAGKIDDITITTTTPSMCSTSNFDVPIFPAVMRCFSRPSHVGARTLVHAAAVAPHQEAHGAYYRYCVPTKPCEFLSTNRGKEFLTCIWDEMREICEKINPKIRDLVL